MPPSSVFVLDFPPPCLSGVVWCLSTDLPGRPCGGSDLPATCRNGSGTLCVQNPMNKIDKIYMNVLSSIEKWSPGKVRQI